MVAVGMPSSTPVFPSDSRGALVVGATGIGGSAPVDLLTEQGRPVTALSRRPIEARFGVTPLAADLRSAEEFARVPADQQPTHVLRVLVRRSRISDAVEG
ncbi:hypothetical protein C5C31_07270 [Rathayibacter rathayi]|nr:hypothetical protein C5C02_12980 [Rathayibacter rathayi]PPG74604.1 hypothetical protein C5C23_12520 [Rathayibacter rathayi]PPH23476.1 hypothetical protein C5C31_07270 [Rathayibacter rathayi]PPI76183.1 hypothetical protein C5E03_11210 [Rathayibacter rathayi]